MKDKNDLLQTVRVYQKRRLLAKLLAAKIGEQAGGQCARPAGRI